MKRSLRRALERLSLYLPLGVMALLAAASYWLVRVTPLPGPEASPRAPSHAPDYVMTQLTVRSYGADGQLRSELAGASARHHPDTDALVIEAVRLQSRDAQGHTSLATARLGFTDSAGERVRLEGDVRIERAAWRKTDGRDEPALRLLGQSLWADLPSDSAHSEQPVQLFRAGDSFSAQRMRLDNRARVLELQGQVRVQLAGPRP